MMERVRPKVFAAFFLLSVAAKLFPYVLDQIGVPIKAYPWNFSPILPICLFGAAMFARRTYAFVIPLAAWFVGDIGILLLTGKVNYAVFPGQWLQYSAFAVVVAIGLPLRERRKWLHVAGAGLGGAVLFFLVSNFGVWAYGDGMRFSHTFSGLVACYTFAIPYFRYTLISMAVFLPILFSRVVLTAPSPAANLATQAG
jgi:Family of unknown function (DUF6580)